MYVLTKQQKDDFRRGETAYRNGEDFDKRWPHQQRVGWLRAKQTNVKRNAMRPLGAPIVDLARLERMRMGGR